MAYLALNKSGSKFPIYDTWGTQIGTMYNNEAFTYVGSLNNVYDQIYALTSAKGWTLCCIKKSVPASGKRKWTYVNSSGIPAYCGESQPFGANGAFYCYVDVKKATNLYNGAGVHHTSLPVGTRVWIDTNSTSGSSNKHYIRTIAYRKPGGSVVNATGYFADTGLRSSSSNPALRGNW